MDNLTRAAMQFPAMHSLWLGSESDLERYNIYVWINDVSCTADPARVSDEPDEELALFSDELKAISVPVVDFYEVLNLLKQYNIEGYELYADASGNLTGVELYHASYDGIFYYAVDGEKPDEYAHNLQGDWWFMEP